MMRHSSSASAFNSPGSNFAAGPHTWSARLKGLCLEPGADGRLKRFRLLLIHSQGG